MNDAQAKARPAWLAPVIIAVVVVLLITAGKKKDEAVENPVVDIALLTIGVFAFAALFRWAAVHMGAPGLATFFGAPAQTHPDHPDTVSV